MTTAILFQWVQLKQSVPNSPVKAGNRGVVLDHLNPTKTQLEPGYILEVFQDGETLDVVSVPVSWVNPLPESWGSTENIAQIAKLEESKIMAESSGSLFQDRGFLNIEEKLASVITDILEQKQLTHQQAGEILNLEIEQVQNLTNGILKDFTIEQLLMFLVKLGQNIEIMVKNHTE